MKENHASHHLNRRDFAKTITTFLGSIMGVVTGLPIIGYIVSPVMKVQPLDEWITLGLLDDYPIGIPKFFGFTRSRVNGWEKTVNSYGVFVYRKGPDELVVFSDICTHLACKVKWHEDTQEYISPCHDGRFDIDGNVTKGPPPRPLDQFDYKIEDGNLFIHLV
jgi:Rieske Fe-S protein